MFLQGAAPLQTANLLITANRKPKWGHTRAGDALVVLLALQGHQHRAEQMLALGNRNLQQSVSAVQSNNRGCIQNEVEGDKVTALKNKNTVQNTTCGTGWAGPISTKPQ